MTTFPMSLKGRLPPIINGTAWEEIAAEHYTVNLQLNPCHEIAAGISSPLQKVNHSDIRTFLSCTILFHPLFGSISVFCLYEVMLAAK